MAVGLGRFTELLQPFEELRRAGLLEHAVQTNATLVDAAWCDLFTEYGFRVGVSIDGPPELAPHRVDRTGRSAHRLIMKGIDCLQGQGVAFSVLAVVGQETIGHPEALLDFLASLHGVSIGINIEEYEGANTERTPPTREQAVEFWRSAIGWTRQNPDAAPIRELDRLGRYLRMSRRQQGDRRAKSRIDPLPTVAANGDVVLLSPELSGIAAPAYDDFRAGNVLSESIASMLMQAPRLRYVREFLTGLEKCESTCEFFDYCQGSQAGNRYFERNTFAEAETNYCRVTDQAPVIALTGLTREE